MRKCDYAGTFDIPLLIVEGSYDHTPVVCSICRNEERGGKAARRERGRERGWREEEDSEGVRR